MRERAAKLADDFTYTSVGGDGDEYTLNIAEGLAEDIRALK